MVERCARAMQASKAWPAVFDAGSAEVLARAVIEALMTPTPEMVEAGALTLLDYRENFPEDGAAATFEAMLRTILSQPNDEGGGK